MVFGCRSRLIRLQGRCRNPTLSGSLPFAVTALWLDGGLVDCRGHGRDNTCSFLMTNLVRSTGPLVSFLAEVEPYSRRPVRAYARVFP